MNLVYANTNHSTCFHAEKVPYITFPALSDLGFIRHGFSTRLGGISVGDYSTMNLSYTRGDDPSSVDENFRRISKALSIPVSDMVYSDQTHTVNILAVDDTNKGMGISRERNFHDIDGLVTDRPGLCLVTSYADCVPLYFADPVRKVIGLSHSGWRGTVADMAGHTVSFMKEHYGSDPADLIAVIGPSICRNCYEIGEDVAEEFAEAYGPEVFDGILAPKENRKFLLNLWEANRINLKKAGLADGNIHITDLCTCCNSSLLHSHRASHGHRGGMCAFLMII